MGQSVTRHVKVSAARHEAKAGIYDECKRLVTTCWEPLVASCIFLDRSIKWVHVQGVVIVFPCVPTCQTFRSPDGPVKECDIQRVIHIFCVAPKDTPPSPHSLSLPDGGSSPGPKRPVSHGLRVDRHPFGARNMRRQGRGATPIFTSTSHSRFHTSACRG